jgi:hypothetical protein
MENTTATAAPEAPEPDLQTALYEFNVATIEIYKDLLCDGERIASRHLFRAACVFGDRMGLVLHAEPGLQQKAVALDARRRIQECLYWLWLVDERGYLSGREVREQAFRNGFVLHEALTGLIAESRSG